MIQLLWQKCQGDIWGPFLGIDLSHVHFNSMEGVYIIWQAKGPIVRIGQGVIKDRIADHRADQAITAYSNLYATWAQVLVQYRNGIERYLADVLNPKIGDAFPDVAPIEVNLPPW